MHMRTLEALPEVETVHVCHLGGGDRDTIRQASSKIASENDRLEDLLERDVDALLVSVRNDECPAALDAAVDAGKPALFEKPGALTAERLRGIAEAASSKGLTMGTMLTFRNDPVILDVKQAVDGAALGEVMAVEARQVTSQVRYRDPTFWLFDKAKAGSGILSWLGCHHIDALCYLLDDRIESVAAMVDTKNPFPIDVEDTACLVLKFKSGDARHRPRGIPLGWQRLGVLRSKVRRLHGSAGHGGIRSHPPLGARGLQLEQHSRRMGVGRCPRLCLHRPKLSGIRRSRGRTIRSSVPSGVPHRCICARTD